MITNLRIINKILGRIILIIRTYLPQHSKYKVALYMVLLILVIIQQIKLPTWIKYQQTFLTKILWGKNPIHINPNIQQTQEIKIEWQNLSANTPKLNNPNNLHNNPKDLIHLGHLIQTLRWNLSLKSLEWEVGTKVINLTG